MKSLGKLIIKLTVVTGMFSIGIPAAQANAFNTCTRELLSSGIEGDMAAVACADALVPSDLSHCVRRIAEKTAISPETALNSCYRVRRPRDLAVCVTNIDSKVLNANVKSEAAEMTTDPLDLALDNCRKSLLPGRYFRCVVGITRQVATISPEVAMNNCLNAEDYPSELFPDFEY